MLNKKAQGISLNVIIVAAIALIVLVVLVVIFSDKMGGFGGTLEEVSGEGKLLLTKHKTLGGMSDKCSNLKDSVSKTGVFKENTGCVSNKEVCEKNKGAVVGKFECDGVCCGYKK